MEPTIDHKKQDTNKYRYRNDLYVDNANLFISNNNNPFLISPYNPNAIAATKQTVNVVSSVVSSLIGDLSTIININTFTIGISTIISNPGPTLTLSSVNLNINSDIVDADVQEFNVYGNSNLSSINTNYISSSNADISNLSVSTLSASTFSIDTETVNFLTVNSTLNASTISTGLLTFSTLLGNQISTNSISTSQITFDTLSGNQISTNSISSGQGFISILGISSLTTSSIFANSEVTTNIYFSTLTGSTITTNTLRATEYVSTQSLIFSSMTMKPDTFSTSTDFISTGGTVSSILINMNGTWWKIPVQLA